MALVDRREIEFDGDSIAFAVTVALQAAEGLGLPPVKPAEIRFVPKESAVHLVYGKGPAARYITLPAEALGSLLISYCVRSRLPLPRKAAKSIRVERASCILAFRTEVPFGPEQASPGPRAALTGDAARSWSWVAHDKEAAQPLLREGKPPAGAGNHS
jgi:hypothetical protein